MVNDKNIYIMDKIEKAASKLIFNFGVKGWNMDDCASNAGITKRTLYQYIPSKKELVEYVLIRFIRSTQECLAKELADTPDFLTGIEIILQIFPQLIIKMESKVMQSIFIYYPDIEANIIRERIKLAEESLLYIKKGQQKGFIKTSIEAETILEILQSLVIFYLKNNPKDFEEKLRTGFTSVLYGILV